MFFGDVFGDFYDFGLILVVGGEKGGGKMGKAIFLGKEGRVRKTELPAVGAAVFGGLNNSKIIGRFPVGNNKFDFIFLAYFFDGSQASLIFATGVNVGVVIVYGKILRANVGGGGNKFESAVGAAGVKE